MRNKKVRKGGGDFFQEILHCVRGGGTTVNVQDSDGDVDGERSKLSFQ